MGKLKLYQVDAFADRLFAGNPAAVCIIDTWLPDNHMQLIANENNLAETAFVVPEGNDFQIRWFTPTTEVDLCGHATLASAFVLFNLLGYLDKEIRFNSMKSGLLTVRRDKDFLFLDFPSDTLKSADDEISILEQCLGVRPVEAFRGKTDYIAVMGNESTVREIVPDLGEIFKLDARGLIVTANGNEVDFVSRFFAPQSGVNEDPVTGSAHTSLIPLWSGKTGKKHMIARQLSKRGGQLICEYRDERCIIGGKAILYMTGEINTA